MRYLSDLLIASTVALATAFAGAALTASGPELGAFAELPPVGATLEEVELALGGKGECDRSSFAMVCAPPPYGYTKYTYDHTGPLTTVSIHYVDARVKGVSVRPAVCDLPAPALGACAAFGLAVAVLSRRVRRCA